MGAKYNERVLNIENILLIKNVRIDQDDLRECCQHGIPDKFRPLAWRLFLDYLPPERQQWAQMLDTQRAHYASLVQNFVARSAEDDGQNGTRRGATAAEQSSDDHPLAMDQNSQWSDYFRDNDTLKQIENDVRRLRPEIDFFQRRTPYPMLQISTSLSKRVNLTLLSPEEGAQLDKLANKSFISPSSRSSMEEHENGGGGRGDEKEEGRGGEKHWEVVERMLYVYAKANPGVAYVQGMNELLGPIYYVFAVDADDEWARHAEADSFYCFQNLMSEMQDIFIRKMDGEHCGIEAALLRFYSRLERTDPCLYRHLVNEQQIKAEFFAFRWISLLLSQEFSLPDLIALWDHLFASKSGTRLQRVECLCLAMLGELRDQLLDGDFPTCLRLLQNFPELIDVSILIIRSVQIANDEEGGGDHNRQQQEKAKSSRNGGQALPALISSMKSRFATPLKSLMADTSAKLAIKMGGTSSGGKLGDEKKGGEATRDVWKNATL